MAPVARGRPSGTGKKKTANDSIVENESPEESECETEVVEKKKRGRPLGSGRSTDSVGKNKDDVIKTSPAKRKRGRPSGTGKNKNEKSNDNKERNKAMRENLGSEDVDTDTESKSFEGSEYEPYEDEVDQLKKKRGRPSGSGKKTKVKSPEEEAGYQFWLSEHPWCNNEDWVTNTAPTTWNLMSSYKKNKWIENSKLDPSVWSALREEKEKKAKVEEAGYQFWLSEHPWSNNEDWVTNTAPTTWNVISSYKKNKWIENSKLDPSVWSALQEEKEKKAKVREEKKAASYTYVKTGAKRGRRPGSGKASNFRKISPPEAAESAAGYKLWLASDPQCNDEDWVDRCAPTKWKILPRDKKKTWIDKAVEGV